MVAGMYDASLDQFALNDWLFNIYPTDGNAKSRWNARGFAANRSRLLTDGWRVDYTRVENRIYPHLNRFGFGHSGYGGRRYAKRSMRSRSGDMPVEMSAMSAPAAAMPESAAMEDQAMETHGIGRDIEVPRTTTPPPFPDTPKGNIPIRKNLKETVFFLPQLKTDKDGSIIIKFKMNEALTRWKFLGLAHTKDLKFLTTQKEIVTQKELMVQPNAPRFFREGDLIEFTAKVSNLSEKPLGGVAEIELLDALTMQPVNALLGLKKTTIPFTAKAGQSVPLSWKLTVPTGKVNAITCLLYTSPSPRDKRQSRMPSSA